MQPHLCDTCGTLVPGEACPHCTASVRPRSTATGTGLAVGAVALLGLTFSACAGDGGVVALYGVEITDLDGDGYDDVDDCDDGDDSVYPGADETAGDGVDSNCDGEDDPQE